MATKKDKAPKLSMVEKAFPAGFAPKPTIYQGGIDRMIRCWTALRAINGGGWGTKFLVTVEGWHFKPNLSDSIACSPFTGTVIAMLFDPDADPAADHFKPVFDGDSKTPLPAMFYHFHNTSLAKAPKKGRVSKQEALARLVDVGVPQKRGLAEQYGCTGSAALWNLGYEIDPRDMRRGDLVHLDHLSYIDKKTGKKKGGGGHATFCWDVHLDAAGSVDCFQYTAANGTYSGGVGISVSASPSNFFFETKGGKYKVKSQFEPYFVDRPEFVERGNWKIVPGHKSITEASIRATGTFKVATPKSISSESQCHALRFWGYPPPDRTTPRGQEAWADPKYAVNFAKAQELAKYPLAAPYCMGAGRSAPVAVPNLTAVTLRAEHLAKPEDVQRVTPKPAVQKPEHATAEQLEVERALDTLFRAGLIETGPGDVENVHDAETVKSVRAFQRRFGLDEDGVAGRVTRPLLFKLADEVRSGRTHVLKPAPEVAKPPVAAKPAAKKPPPAAPVTLGPVAPAVPRIDHFYWLQNHAQPGDKVIFVVEGRDLDVWNFSLARITLTEVTRGTRVTITTPVPFTVGGRGEATVTLPREMTAGTTWGAVLDCEVPTGAVRVASTVMLTLDDRHPAEPVVADEGWPWDERAWPASMRNIVAELRATPRPTDGHFEQWAFSTYGVKEKLNSVGPRDKKTKTLRFADGGDEVPVRDKNGTVYGAATRYSLYAADIEGTMRLKGRVLNITQTGRPRHGKPPHQYEEFDPTQSFWHDVTDRHPWGSGSRVPLIPYRVLAINAAHDSHRYLQKVYVKALDGVRLAPTGEVHNGVCVVGDCGSMDPGKQFDFFKGRQDITFKIDGGLGMFTNSKKVSLPLSDIAFLGECVSAQRKKKK